MKKNIKDLENIDLEELISQVEGHANEVESNFIKMESENGEVDPVTGHRTVVPIFDFEIN